MDRRIETVEERVYQLWLGDELIEYPMEDVERDIELKRWLAELERRKSICEIQFFKPHGAAKFGHDCGFELSSALDWLNDTEHSIAINCSPNQVGKTCLAMVKKILGIIKCNPNWMLFKENGVKFREWQGPKTLVCLGYNRGQLTDVLWPELQKWIPASELGAYAPVHLGGTRQPAWERHLRIPLKCGSRIIMLSYEQDASVCAGIKATEMLADEQMPKSFFSELDERGRTLGGVNWTFSFTPHEVDGRANDTGIYSWLLNVWTGHDTMGHSVERTRITIDEVPERIYGADQKKASYEKWVVAPKRSGNMRDYYEGQARHYGMFQRVSGLYYPEIEPDTHFVEWTYDDIKGKGWTHYRAIDYGYASPTAVGMFAVSPVGDVFLYDEYYVSGKDALEHTPAIIEKCGNKRVLIKKMVDNQTGMTFDVWQEEPVRQHYVRTWLDWHCFQQKGGTGKPISFYFQIGGLRVCESVKLEQEARAQNLRALLKADKMRKHMVTGKLGAPRFYVSRPKCPKWIWEWERCVFETRQIGQERHNPKETKQNKDDHLIDVSEYIASENPRYLGDYTKKEQNVFVPLHLRSGY